MPITRSTANSRLRSRAIMAKTMISRVKASTQTAAISAVTVEEIPARLSATPVIIPLVCTVSVLLICTARSSATRSTEQPSFTLT